MSLPKSGVWVKSPIMTRKTSKGDGDGVFFQKVKEDTKRLIDRNSFSLKHPPINIHHMKKNPDANSGV